ncbi:MAG: cation:proton antiporter, partial [Methanobrevibacter sp.]|nr:cation:proton antiporter [Methanobrevibacter sp.]
MDDILLGLGLIVGLGISLQWIAKIIKIPGIVLLLPAGIIIGPILNLIDPIAIFGNSLFPAVTVGVGILLLKGGLDLDLGKLEINARKSVIRLVTVGGIITLILGVIGMVLITGLNFELAIILSALLVVSGPTVVAPILSYARPKEPVASTLLWESIIIDPIGAAIAVAILSFVLSTNQNPFLDLILTTIIGIIIGIIAGLAYILIDRTNNLPGNLNALILLMLGVIAIVSGEIIYAEAGLFAGLTMGFVIANKKLSPFNPGQAFTETLEPLIIGVLFIVLGSLININDMIYYFIPGLIITLIYILIIRPFVAYISTINLGYSLKERLFIGFLHPRGIVAAATASLFAIDLAKEGKSFPELIPIVFTVIILTVIIYGLLAPKLSKVLNIAEAEPTGIAIYGDEKWAIDLANVLDDLKVKVMLLLPKNEETQRFIRENFPNYPIYNGPISDLGDNDILDCIHEEKKKIRWVIIASSDHDKIRLVNGAFIRSIGIKNMIIFSKNRFSQDELLLNRKMNSLSKTPFGLFAKNPEEFLEI